MTTPKAHEQHARHAEKTADHKHDPAKKPSNDGGAHDAGSAEPTGMPHSDRHHTETVKPEGNR